MEHCHSHLKTMLMKKSNQQNKWTLLGFDSQEEYFFNAWCAELGLNYQYKPTSFVICDAVKLQQQSARSIKEVHLLHSLNYEPDFVISAPFPSHIATISFMVDICINPIKESLKNAIFIACDEVVTIDTKGSNFMGSSRSSDVRFPVIQKIMWDRKGVFVNSVIPEKLFARTFAPECFFFTELGKERTKKINNEFVGFGKLYKRIGDI